MYADASLAARVDRAEARLIEKAARALQARKPDAHTSILPVSGGQAIYISPSSPANKVIGLGFDGPLDVASLEIIEREWQARNEPVRIELSILADPTIAPALSERGYRLHGFENLLARTIADDEPAPHAPGVTIDLLSEADQKTWLDIAVTGFMNLDGTGSPPDDALPREEMERVLEDFGETPGWTRYIARLDGEPAGVASLTRDQGLAQVAGAATLPAFRGRGVQKALLHRRLIDARAAGCDLAVVTTAPGTRSQENVMKRGFQLLYTRAVLIKRWTA